jgi:hypothetical protein
MKKVVIIRPFETGDDTCHAAGCIDLIEDAETSDIYLEFDSLADAKASWDNDEELVEMGWTWDTVTIKPCAKDNN